MALSWKPIKKRGVYCSPACGSNCKLADYKKALKDGARAKKLLKNPSGWKIKVWENGGWHVQLKKGGMNLSVRRQSIMEDTLVFSVLFSSDGGIGGDMAWSNSRTRAHVDPNFVIEEQLDIAQKFVTKCQKAINKVKAA